MTNFSSQGAYSLVDETFKHTHIYMLALGTKEKKKKSILKDTGKSGKILKVVAISNLMRKIFVNEHI